MVWIGRREQVLVGLLFVLLLVTATAGRLGAAGDRFVWLESPAVGKVSVDGATPFEGPTQPTADQVQGAMQRRIRGYELATIQTNLELAGLRQLVGTLRVQVSDGTAKLLEANQDLEFVQDELIKEQSMRENLSRELTRAHQQVQVLTERLQRAEAQVALLRAQQGQHASTESHGESGSLGGS